MKRKHYLAMIFHIYFYY